jgi:hypothetical protein
MNIKKKPLSQCDKGLIISIILRIKPHQGFYLTLRS